MKILFLLSLFLTILFGNRASATINTLLLDKLAVDTPCAPPTIQPSNIIFTSTRDSAKGSFTAVPEADGYLAVFSTNIRLDFTPVDGTAYPVGSTVGNATVLKYGAGATFSKGGLTPNTYYYITFFALKNSSCAGGPVYNSSRPAVALISTKP